MSPSMYGCRLPHTEMKYPIPMLLSIKVIVDLIPSVCILLLYAGCNQDLAFMPMPSKARDTYIRDPTVNFCIRGGHKGDDDDEEGLHFDGNVVVLHANTTDR